MSEDNKPAEDAASPDDWEDHENFVAAENPLDVAFEAGPGDPEVVEVEDDESQPFYQVHTPETAPDKYIKAAQQFQDFLSEKCIKNGTLVIEVANSKIAGIAFTDEALVTTLYGEALGDARDLVAEAEAGRKSTFSPQ